MKDKIKELYPDAKPPEIDFMEYFFEQTNLNPGDITLDEWREYENFIGEINPDKVGGYLENIEKLVRHSYSLGVKQKNKEIQKLTAKIDKMEIGQGDLFE